MLDHNGLRLRWRRVPLPKPPNAEQSEKLEMSDLTACYYGSVNRWECDENDHLNVRYFASKVNQALAVYLFSLGKSADDTKVGPALSVAWQHIRFLNEARVATPLRIDCGMASRGCETIEVVSFMRNNLSEELLCTFVTSLHQPGRPLEGSMAGVSELPDEARPRGIDVDNLYPRVATMDEAKAAGFKTMGRGLIGADECDSQGELYLHNYIGRISDGMPNLWALVGSGSGDDNSATQDIGRIALEYRLKLIRPLRANHVYRHMSGIRSLGRKTQHMVHQVFDETLGRCAASAEVVSVAMDLQARRSLAMSEERRRLMEHLLLD